MAPTTTDDFTFIMTCIKYSSEKMKPNFEEVAQEVGAKNANACYHRHWGIMKKWGLAGHSGKGRQTASTIKASTATATIRKRKSEATEVEGNDKASDDSPTKKIKRAVAKKRASVPVKVESVDEEERVGSGNGDSEEAVENGDAEGAEDQE